MGMTYATVASGIDAPALAWNPLGWEQLFSSEIEKFPNAILAHHYPDVPNMGDMNNFWAFRAASSSREAMTVEAGIP